MAVVDAAISLSEGFHAVNLAMALQETLYQSGKATTGNRRLAVPRQLSFSTLVVNGNSLWHG